MVVQFLSQVREELRELTKDYDKSEDDLKALQSGVGQIVGEVLRQLTEDKCMYGRRRGCSVVDVRMFYSLLWFLFSSCIVIVKASNGPRYVVGCRRQVCILVKLVLGVVI